MRPLFAVLISLVVITSPLAADQVDYVRDIRPILTKHCYECHGGQKQRSGLRLDATAAILAGGNSGPGIVPGNSGASKLIKAVTGADDTKLMPPREPRLSALEVGLLKTWIDQGARAPATELPQKPSGGDVRHWAFQVPVR